MFCRRAWQRIGPLARRLAFRPSTRNAPVRHMAFGVPGGSTNMTYVLLCGGGLTAAVVYAYKTVSGDSERHEDRLANMGSPAKAPEEAEATPVEEAVSAIEVISELVPAPVAAETAAEPIIEAVSMEASEVIVAEAQAEAAVTEEAAPPAEEEEAVPVVEAETEVETSDEAPTAESTGTAAVDEVPPAPAAEAETEPEAPEAPEAEVAV